MCAWVGRFEWVCGWAWMGVGVGVGACVGVVVGVGVSACVHACVHLCVRSRLRLRARARLCHSRSLCEGAGGAGGGVLVHERARA